MASGKDVKNLKSQLDGDELDLSMTELSVVPVREIAALKKVTKLDLSSNKIVSLPDDFCTLKNLVKLDLSSNKLRELPENFGKLEHLQHLDLYKNSLETLPVSFAQMKQLRWLDVKDNPLDDSLRKVAGDCLNPKQCAEAATKVVQHMQKINSDRERERQKQLKKQRDAEAAERTKEEEAKNVKATEKKKEKERKKQENNKRGAEKHDEDVKEPKQETELKRAAQREKGSPKQEKQGRKKKSRGILGCIGWIFSCLIGLLFLTAFTAAALSGILYFNCSRPSGQEFIPKSRELCQDLYQSLQTGRISSLSWDYKASLLATSVALQKLGTTVLESVRQFDYVGWKNAIVDAALTARDTIVRLSIWTYENGSEIAKPILKQLAEWFWVAFAVAVFLVERASHYAILAGQWTIDTAVDVVNNFPTYWEKVKVFWKNLK